MLKPNLIKLAIYLVLAGGFLLLAFNAHMDIYPCTKSDYDFQRERCSIPQSSTCDLLSIRRSGGRADCPATLSGGGWAVAILVHGIAPYFVAAIAGHFIARRKRA
jgi:hypothetical protein